MQEAYDSEIASFMQSGEEGQYTPNKIHPRRSKHIPKIIEGYNVILNHVGLQTLTSKCMVMSCKRH